MRERMPLLRLGLLLGLGLVAFAPAWTEAATTPCAVARVIDGDTVELSCLGMGQFRARLTGFDTPETHRPRCAEEAVLGQMATRHLHRLVANARRIEARIGRLDRYDRRLVALAIDGRDVGAQLIEAGLATAYDGGRRVDWCARLQ